MPTKNKYSHNDLVQIGLKWMKKNGFALASAELKSLIKEIPDIVGFRAESSMIIECKCSMADFRADFKKPHRTIDGLGVGNYRLYLAEKGVLDINKIPSKWGFLEVDEKGRVEVVRFKKGNIYVGNLDEKRSQTIHRMGDDQCEFHHDSNIANERTILYSMLRRQAKS